MGRGALARPGPAASEFIRALVCGMPRPRRESAFVKSLSRVYIDETGGTVESAPTPTFLMAGYMSDIDTWAGFSDCWTRVLMEHGVAAFHGFESWKLQEPQRSSLYGSLVSVIERHDVWGFIVRMSIKDHREVVLANLADIHGARMRRLGWDDPYGFMAWKLVLGMLGHYGETAAGHESFQFMLDYYQRFSGYAVRAERWMYALLRARHPDQARWFAGMKMIHLHERPNHIPVQAADFLAWFAQRTLNHSDGFGQPTWERLRHTFYDVEFKRPWLEHFMRSVRNREPWLDELTREVRLSDPQGRKKRRRAGGAP